MNTALMRVAIIIALTLGVWNAYDTHRLATAIQELREQIAEHEAQLTEAEGRLDQVEGDLDDKVDKR